MSLLYGKRDRAENKLKIIDQALHSEIESETNED